MTPSGTIHPHTHVWLYSASIMLFVTAVAHAIVGSIYHEPAAFVNLHIALALAVGFAGWRFEHETRKGRHIRDAADRLERAIRKS